MRKSSRIRFRRGDLLAVDTPDGRNAIAWSFKDLAGIDIDAVDSIEAGDFCLCLDPKPFFKGYTIVLTSNGIIGYVRSDQLDVVVSIL